jgi:hypothetical protein
MLLALTNVIFCQLTAAYLQLIIEITLDFDHLYRNPLTIRLKNAKLVYLSCQTVFPTKLLRANNLIK